jgi:hypothetical protein
MRNYDKQLYYSVKNRLNCIKPNFILEYRFRSKKPYSPAFLLPNGFGRAKGYRILIIPTHYCVKTYLDRLIILSHEWGHFVRFQTNFVVANEACSLYGKAISGKEITDEEAKMIYNEEVFAWEFGERLLKDCFEEEDNRWNRFATLKNKMLSSYKRFLSME